MCGQLVRIRLASLIMSMRADIGLEVEVIVLVLSCNVYLFVYYRLPMHDFSKLDGLPKPGAIG